MIPTIYTAKIRGISVRFFPPQASAPELMPWVDVDALMEAMGLPGDKRGVADFLAKENPKHAARIGTSKGFTNIISFTNAKGLIQGSIAMGYVSATFEHEYATPLFAATRLIHPELFDQDDETDEGLISSTALARLMGTTPYHLADLIDNNRDELVKRGRLRRG